MTLVTVSTVKGAPGGTTVALLIARRFAEVALDRVCVLAECDLSGGDLAPALCLAGVPGIASLALAARHGLTSELLLLHTQRPTALPGLRVLPGVAGPEQGAALDWMLAELGAVLADASVLAVADLGRPVDGRWDGLCEVAVANVLVAHDGLASLLHAKVAAEAAAAAGRPLAVVVAGDRRWRLAQVAETVNAEVLGTVRFDAPALSTVLRPGGSPGAAGTRLARQSSGLLSDIDAIVTRLAERVGIAEPDTGAEACVGRDGQYSQRVIARLRRRMAVTA